MALQRRIFGLETEVGIACYTDRGVTVGPDEIARNMFRPIVSWGRSSNVFLPNGARLYLDVGSHPEYATGECDDIIQLITHDRAGERILQSLADSAEERLRLEGTPVSIHLFKNNTDSVGNSYGCHENYLVPRNIPLGRYTDVLVPFLVTRTALTGAGGVVTGATGTNFVLSPRSDHVWDAVSSATTRSRPIINTRDEPHADPELYRRLHVIVGDSSRSESTTMLKVGATDLILRMIEHGMTMYDMILESPIRSIREVSSDLSGRAPLRLASGRTITAVEMQEEFFSRAAGYAQRELDSTPLVSAVLDLWERGLTAINTGDFAPVQTELDWVIKKRVIDRYCERNGVDLTDARVARLDLAYHDLSRGNGLFESLERAGEVKRLTREIDVLSATVLPPATTRARLRGEFVRRAHEVGAEHTVDWVHLRLNDAKSRTVACRDPFISSDDRVDRLIAAMGPLRAAHAVE